MHPRVVYVTVYQLMLSGKLTPLVATSNSYMQARIGAWYLLRRHVPGMAHQSLSRAARSHAAFDDRCFMSFMNILSKYNGLTSWPPQYLLLAGLSSCSW